MQSPSPSSPSGSAWRRLLPRLAVTAVALGWALSRLRLDALGEALGSLPALGLLLATLSWTATLAVAAVRWRLLLLAFGAERPPGLGRLYRLSWEALFYNTLLPANVAGDLLRAAVTTRAFDRPAGAWLVVVLDRGSGLLALLALAWAVGLLDPAARLAGVGWLALLVAAGFLGLALLPGLLRRWLPPGGARPAGWLGRLPAPPPPLRRPLALLGAPLVSLVAHGIAGAAAWLLLGEVPLAAAVGRVPVALASAYLPTVAGLGAREAAFTLLFEPLGVPAERAVAASLGILACQLVAAAAGGVVHLHAARQAPSEDDAGEPDEG